MLGRKKFANTKKKCSQPTKDPMTEVEERKRGRERNEKRGGEGRGEGYFQKS
jgi:hypothetical protein